MTKLKSVYIFDLCLPCKYGAGDIKFRRISPYFDYSSPPPLEKSKTTPSTEYPVGKVSFWLWELTGAQGRFVNLKIFVWHIYCQYLIFLKMHEFKQKNAQKLVFFGERRKMKF